MTDPTKNLTPEAREKVAAFQRGDLSIHDLLEKLDFFREPLETGDILRAILNEKDAEIERLQRLVGNYFRIIQCDEAVTLLRETADRLKAKDHASGKRYYPTYAVGAGERIDALLARIDSADEGHALVETMGHIDGMDDEDNDESEVMPDGSEASGRRSERNVTEGAGEKPDPARPEADPVAADASADSPAPDLALPVYWHDHVEDPQTVTKHRRAGSIVIYDADRNALFATDYWYDLLANNCTRALAVRHADAIVEAVNGWYSLKRRQYEIVVEENDRLEKQVQDMDDRHAADLNAIMELEDLLKRSDAEMNAGTAVENQRLRTALEKLDDIVLNLQINTALKTAAECEGWVYEDYMMYIQGLLRPVIDATRTKEEDDGPKESEVDMVSDRTDSGHTTVVDHSGPAEVTPFAPRKTDEPFMLERHEDDSFPARAHLARSDRNAAKLEAEVEALWRALAGDEWEDHRAEWMGRNG